MPFVGLALVFDIASDDPFVDANRTAKVAFRPNTVGAPVNLFEKRKFGLHISSRVLFDDTDYLSNAHGRRNRNQQVNVIFVCIDLFELDLRVVLVNGFDSGNDEGLDAVVYNLAPVFGRKHEVIVTEKNRVG